jgi:hypothetical protein
LDGRRAGHRERKYEIQINAILINFLSNYFMAQKKEPRLKD